MTRYSNFIKATSLTPNTAETLYKLIDSTPELKKTHRCPVRRRGRIGVSSESGQLR